MRNPKSKVRPDTRSHQARKFLRDLVKVCRKHNLSLTHEDDHGAFVVAPADSELDTHLLGSFERGRSGNTQYPATQVLKVRGRT